MIVPSQLQVLAAEAQRAPSSPVPPRFRRRKRIRSNADVVIRLARRGDAGAIRDLEALDGRVLADGPRLVAEMDDKVVAALSVADGVVAADPFVCTVNAVALLRLRARQLRIAGTRRPVPGLTLIERLAR
jgi:hypothetical protein